MYFCPTSTPASEEAKDGKKAEQDDDGDDDEIFTKQENFERDLAIQKEVEFSKEFNHKSKYTYHFQEPGAFEVRMMEKQLS